MDPNDNLNLLQPVNPFNGLQKRWSMYTEYFQFQPVSNSNSKNFPVHSGQTLHGSIVYNVAEDSYTLSQTIVETGDVSSQVVKCQNGKKFVIPYVVYEKKWPCSWYPPDGSVTFRNITVECDGVDCTKDVQWEAKVRDANCNMRASIDSENNQISLLWDTHVKSSVDGLSKETLIVMNAHGWGAEQAKMSLEELEFEKVFERFVVDFGKTYRMSERSRRYEIFRDNLKFIRQTNEENRGFELGVNSFSDMSIEEFKATHLGLQRSDETIPRLGVHEYSGAALPDTVDWTSSGAVTPVKDQKACGSCWAFSAVGALEGAWQLSKGALVSLSEQQFVDCAKSFGNDGCGGGLMDQAFQYAVQMGLCSESDYPYEAADGTCRMSSCTAVVPSGAVTGYQDVKKEDVQALMEAVSKQPVSVGVEADGYYFKNYKSGVLIMPCGDNLDHGVLLVGYGSDAGQDYWKIKNSWGSHWGEDGYIRFGRGGQEPPWGECGVQEQASYPVIQAQNIFL